VQIEPAGQGSARIRLTNRYGFTDVNTLDGRWSLACDGLTVQSGAWSPPDLAPGSGVEVPIPVGPIAWPQPGASYRLRVSLHLREDTAWAQAGHEVAWGQMTFAVATPQVRPIRAEDLPALRVTEEASQIRVEGKAFAAVFSREQGTLVRLVYQNKEVLAPSGPVPSGPVLQAFRAPTSNDKAFGRGRARDWQQAGLDRLTRQVSHVRVTRSGVSFLCLEVLSMSTTPTGAGFRHTCTWTIRGDGSIDLENRFEPFGSLPPLPRIGLVLRVAPGLESLRWYGRGPHENYADRCQSADVGIWQSTVDAQCTPYPRPQETGTRTDVGWLALTGPDRTGLLVVADPAMAASALHHTAEDLSRATHTHDLRRREEVVLSLDARHSGLGNGSCGPGVLPCYEVQPVPCSLRVSLRPCPAAPDAEIARLARRVYDDPADPGSGLN